MTNKTFAINLAKKAGQVMLANFKIGMEREWKKDGTPVTVTDLKVNRLVVDAVKKYYPAYGVLGEEESYNLKNFEYLWVCDPVDGTLTFSHGLPIFVFSLALVKAGAPILGVVYDPVLKRMFFAEKNQGAFLNGKKIQVNSGDLKNSVLSWETQNLNSIESMSRLKKKYPKINLLNLYSICYVGGMIACGQLTGSFCGTVFPHDIAAIKVIVEEAGGKVTDIHGKEQRYDRQINGALITNGKIHRELLKIIN